MNNSAVAGGGGALYQTCKWPSAAMLQLFLSTSIDARSIQKAESQWDLNGNTAKRVT
jgi:hypothetical protein